MTEADHEGLPSSRDHHADSENPWPGLAAFLEGDADFFEGRDAEAESLERLVLRDRLTVMFGSSGLGKTSLLHAGLFPRLRNESIFPIYIRLDYSQPELDLRGQVLRAVMEAAGSNYDVPSADASRTLWEYFHRKNADFWDERNRLVTPLLVFDQFEEIFTHGQSSAARARAAAELVSELADLIEGHPPAEVRARVDSAREAAREFSYKRHPYKVLLSLREDFLPQLEEFRHHIPSIAYNRMRLQRMNGVSAMKVAARDPALMSEEVAQRVVRFVAAVDDSEAETPFEEMEIEPAQLCVVCRELNNKRRENEAETITAALLEGTQDEILVDLYERSVSDLAPELRILVEERLLTVSGFRDSLAIENALQTPGVTEEEIAKLINRRLLHAETSGEVKRIELTHDLLTGVIAQSRDARRLREKEKLRRKREDARRREEEKQRRAEEEKAKADRKLWRARRGRAVVIMVLCLVGTAWWQREARLDAEEESKSLVNVLNIEQACKKDNNEDQCKKLEKLYKDEEDTVRTRKGWVRFTVPFLRIACAFRGANACVRLAALSENGDADTIDADRARDFYKRATKRYRSSCGRGKAESCGRLADLYHQGRGVPQDAALSADLYERACNEDVAESCASLGVLLQWGRGRPKNESRAATLFEQSCAADSAAGCYNLGLLHRWRPSADEHRTTRELYQKACDAGHAGGCAGLGELYEEGLGGEKNLAFAAELYQRACDAGSVQACHQIGFAYEKGRGVPNDLVHAVSSYAQACDEGMSLSCYRLGLQHQTGRNSKRAAELFQRACDGGKGAGCYELAKVVAKGRGLELKDPDLAAQLREQACHRGHPRSCQLVRIANEAPSASPVTEPEISDAQSACETGDSPFCLQLGQHYESIGESAEAERRYVAAVVSGTAPDADPATLTGSLYTLATFYTRADRQSEAVPLYSVHASTLKRLEEARGERDPVYSRSAGNLAALYASRTMYTKAIRRYEDAIETQEEAIQRLLLQEDDPEYRAALTNLAMLRLYKHDYDEAEQALQKALNTKSSDGGGAEDGLYAKSSRILALLHEQTGRPAQAEVLFQQSLEILRTVSGASDLEYAAGLIDLALLYERSGWDADAESHYRDAFEISKSTGGVDSPYYTTSFRNLASLYIRRGKCPEAETLLGQEGVRRSAEESGTRAALYKTTLEQLTSVCRPGNGARD